jgi:hypothetical protein
MTQRTMGLHHGIDSMPMAGRELGVAELVHRNAVRLPTDTIVQSTRRRVSAVIATTSMWRLHLVNQELYEQYSSA